MTTQIGNNFLSKSVFLNQNHIIMFFIFLASLLIKLIDNLSCVITFDSNIWLSIPIQELLENDWNLYSPFES